MGNQNKTEKRPHKLVALITYIIALVALLLGLFLPFCNIAGVEGTDAIWAFQLPQALNAIVPIEGLDGVGAKLTYSFPVTFNGLIEGGFDLGALFTLLYALTVLAGLCALVPAIVNTFSKKSRKNTALKAASVIEVLAFLFTSIFVFIQLTKFSFGDIEGYQWSWALLAAFGGTLLMLIVQAIFYRKGSGLIKFLLFVLSTLAVLLCVYDLGVLIPALKPSLDKMTGDLGSGLYSQLIGIAPVVMFFCGGTFMSSITLTQAIELLDPIDATLFIFAFIVSFVALVNFLLDTMGMGKNTKKFMLISNVVRFSLQLALAIVVIVLPFFTENATLGIMAIVLAVLSVASLIINIFRLVALNAKRKKIHKAVQEEKEKAIKEANGEAQPATQDPVYDEPVIYHEPEEAPVFAEEPQAVYNPIIYNGPIDEFIKTLSTEQKVEFSRVFLERQNGNLNYIPNYNVGGKNDKFFNSVFIYFARLRNIISDGVINKMYEYKNLMD